VGDVSLRDQISGQIRDAMRSGDKVRVGTLRMFLAAIVNREKDVLHELSDDEVRQVAVKEVKRRNESIEAFQAAGREDLVNKETAERQILEPFAPARLSDEAVDLLIDEAIASSGATSVGDMGAVMRFVMDRAKGQVDGGAVQQKVRARLGG
jgi:uncharacterized protein YqeY